MILKEAKEFADSNGLFHFEVSAKNNINIKEVFLAIAKKLPLNDKLNDTTGVKVKYIYYLIFEIYFKLLH
jgi:hypothetical protein